MQGQFPNGEEFLVNQALQLLLSKILCSEKKGKSDGSADRWP